MSELLSGATVLIVDQDVGLAFWLGEIFSEVGCQAVPALDYTQAVSIIRELNLKIDLVVVNPGLPRVSDLIRTLQRAHRPLKIIAIHEGHVPCIRMIDSDAILERPSGWEPISREQWLGRVRKILHDVLAKGAD